MKRQQVGRFSVFVVLMASLVLSSVVTVGQLANGATFVVKQPIELYQEGQNLAERQERWMVAQGDRQEAWVNDRIDRFEAYTLADAKRDAQEFWITSPFNQTVETVRNPSFDQPLVQNWLVGLALVALVLLVNPALSLVYAVNDRRRRS